LTGLFAPGDELPSITELSALQGIGTVVARHALETLAAGGLILLRRGQTAIVAGNADSMPSGARKQPRPGHEGRRAGVELDIKGGRHYTASQLLAGGFDLRNTAARLGHSGGGATTLRHLADPVPRSTGARQPISQS